VIGLACLEQVLAEDGWTVANLGADLPAADLGAFVGRNEVDFVALSALDPARVGSLADSVLAVRAATADRRVPVVVGGQIAAVPGLADTVGADGVARSLAEAVSIAAANRPS
jgi:methanogenic corrinoid protein MtbC1